MMERVVKFIDCRLIVIAKHLDEAKQNVIATGNQEDHDIYNYLRAFQMELESIKKEIVADEIEDFDYLESILYQNLYDIKHAENSGAMKNGFSDANTMILELIN